MAIIGRLLKNRRAGETHLAWNLPALAGPETLELRSDAFEHGGTIPLRHAGRRAGGENVSPALEWSGVPAGTAQLLLVVEDVDTPTPRPFVHLVALVDPALTALPAGVLTPEKAPAGVQILRSGMGRGYLGPEPIKGHGPHRYVFQLFALPHALTADTATRPRALLATVPGPALARARLDGLHER